MGLTNVSVFIEALHFAILRLMWLGQAKGLSKNLAKNKISVNTIALSAVESSALEKNLTKKAKTNQTTIAQEKLNSIKNIPMKKHITLEEVANISNFLLSSDSDGITGTNIAVDNGFSRCY